MAAVYILYSKTLHKFYIGSCKLFDYRLGQHLSKELSKSFTSKATDWKTFLLINDLNYGQARSIEKYIKRMKSKVYIKNLSLYEELRQKLVEMFR